MYFTYFCLYKHNLTCSITYESKQSYSVKTPVPYSPPFVLTPLILTLLPVELAEMPGGELENLACAWAL